jgi:hypothetical protein
MHYSEHQGVTQKPRNTCGNPEARDQCRPAVHSGQAGRESKTWAKEKQTETGTECHGKTDDTAIVMNANPVDSDRFPIIKVRRRQGKRRANRKNAKGIAPISKESPNVGKPTG